MFSVADFTMMNRERPNLLKPNPQLEKLRKEYHQLKYGFEEGVNINELNPVTIKPSFM